MPANVEAVAVGEVYDLRHAVLSPTLAPESGRRPGDEDPRARHFAVRDHDLVVAVGSVLPQAAEWEPDTPGWRVRGMAVAPEHRNRGLGTAVLETIIAYVVGQGGGLLWCTARIAAISLYRRAGMSTRGEIFEFKDDPHIIMWRHVGTRG